MNCTLGSRAAPQAPVVRAARPSTSRAQSTVVRAEYRRNEGFWTGFAIGGAVFGAAGFFFAPQISRAILNEQQKIQIPDWFDNQEEKPQVTKADLEEKIAKLHAAINDVATQVGPESKQKNANSAVASPVAK